MQVEARPRRDESKGTLLKLINSMGCGDSVMIQRNPDIGGRPDRVPVEIYSSDDDPKRIQKALCLKGSDMTILQY